MSKIIRLDRDAEGNLRDPLTHEGVTLLLIVEGVEREVFGIYFRGEEHFNDKEEDKDDHLKQDS